MRLRVSELAAAAAGAVHLGSDVEVTGTAIDSRLVVGGELFVAVRAERDGHEFVDAAFAAGAAACLVDRSPPGGSRPAIVVDDTVEALGALGRFARGRLGPVPVVGITGSVGKTTVKDLVRAVLARRGLVAASERSFNNELGVPLTLLNAPEAVTAAVVEMGARGIGHIAALCAIAAPTIGVVTRVAVAHTELFGSLDEVAVGKGELVEALPPHGTAVLNADDARVAAMASRSAAPVLLYGEARHADVRASDVRVDDGLHARFRLSTPVGEHDVRLALAGRHQVSNALAAAAAGVAAEIDVAAIAEGLAAPPASPWRMEVHDTPSGAVVINDAYNANPASMVAALESVATVEASRRFAVLGVMAELGSESVAEHQEVARLARRLGVEVIAVDTDLYGVTPVGGAEGALGALRARGAPAPGDVVLVKGSRVAGLERVVDALVA